MDKDYKKLYEEALERAKDLHDNHPLGQPQTWITCEKIFPELSESEDERIRKDIIDWLINYKVNVEVDIKDEEVDKWVSWLEKQGEQKPADKVDVLMSLDEAIEHCKEKSCGNSACALEHEQLEKWLTELKELKEQKPVEQDTEIRDSWVYIREWNDKFGRLPKDEDELAACIDYVMKRQKSADKIEKNPDWSKEDEEMLNKIIRNIEFPSGIIAYRKPIDEMISWLKLLHPQSHWKPSEEQMKALSAINMYGEFSYVGQGEILLRLYNDLKTL